MGELELELCARNEELKQVAQDTAIAYKKYEIRIENEKKENELTRNKMREKD